MNNTNRSDDNHEIIGDIVDAIGIIDGSCVNSVNNGVVTNVDLKRNTNSLSPQMEYQLHHLYQHADQGFGIEFEMSHRSLNPAKSTTSGSYSMGIDGD